MLVIERPILHRRPRYGFPLKMRVFPILPSRRIRKGMHKPIYGYKPRPALAMRPKPIATFAYGYKPKWHTPWWITVKNPPYRTI